MITDKPHQPGRKRHFPHQTLMVPQAHIGVACGVKHDIAGLYAERKYGERDHAIIAISRRERTRTPFVIVAHMDAYTPWETSFDLFAKYFEGQEGETKVCLSYAKAFSLNQKVILRRFERNIGCCVDAIQERRFYVNLKSGYIKAIPQKKRKDRLNMDLLEAGSVEKEHQTEHIKNKSRIGYRHHGIVKDSIFGRPPTERVVGIGPKVPIWFQELDLRSNNFLKAYRINYAI